jgi:ribonuclease BN (tRNA processing enzyme)
MLAPMTATLSVLGAGSILPRVGYGCAGYALRAQPGGAVTLLDCGPGSIRALAGVGIGLTEVRRVVLSHYHLDHCLDLFALAFARHNPTLGGPDGMGEIELVGPRGLADRLAGAPALLGRWAAMPNARIHEVEPGEELVRDGLRWRSVANGHTPEALSWRVEPAAKAAPWSLVYTGDTRDDPRVAELARGAGVLLSECSFPEEEGAENHLTPTSAARLARTAGVKRLILTHFYPSMDPEEARVRAGRVYDGPIELAADGRVFGLGEGPDGA